MAYSIALSKQAKADIESAVTYIAARSPEAASRWYRSIVGALTSLAELPARCPIAPESALVGVELRNLVHGKRRGVYRVVFRIMEAELAVHVVAVRHSARRPLTEEDMATFLDI